MKIQGAYAVFSNTAFERRTPPKKSPALPAYKANQSNPIDFSKKIEPNRKVESVKRDRVRPDHESERIEAYLKRERRASTAYKILGMGNFVNMAA